MNTIKQISVVGVGRLGLCLSLNLERSGYHVIGVDKNLPYISSLNNKTFTSSEPSVDRFLKESQNFQVYSELKECLASDVIFIVLPTPSLPSGKYNHQHIDDVIQELIAMGVQPTKKYLVISSTVDPGYCDKTYAMIKDYNYEIVYNPEFIAQGSIIKDQLSPDIILLGFAPDSGGQMVETIYETMCINQPVICKMSLMEAEITKIALNCFITTKIAYANMVGDIVNRLGLSPYRVLNAIGLDARIGNKCLGYGFGFGGPCFPRDNRAFGTFCEEHGIYPHISYATDNSNKSHLIYQLKDFVANNPDQSKEILFESVTYKPNTDIIEESQKLKFAVELQRFGYKVRIKDSVNVISQLKRLYGDKFSYETV